MDATEFQDLVRMVEVAGFKEEADMMRKRRDGTLIKGDYFEHIRSGERYVLVTMESWRPAPGENVHLMMYRV